MTRRKRIVVSGRVQGVCFRMFAAETARGLGLRGWVRNLPDGTVEAMAEGEEASVTDFQNWCRRGPPAAVVTSVDVTDIPETDQLRGFSIIH